MSLAGCNGQCSPGDVVLHDCGFRCVQDLCADKDMGWTLRAGFGCQRRRLEDCMHAAREN
eukprot:2186392-Alexandrium_andersonii.AAC.1